MELRYEINTNGETKERTLSIKLVKEGQEYGHFTMSGHAPENEGPLLDPLQVISLTIFVEDEYTGQKWSRRMIREMIQKIGPYMSDDQLLYIDADSSNGYWTSIGMKPNPHYVIDDSHRVIGDGYELVISYGDLKKYAFPEIGGKRSRRTLFRNRSFL
jgi:hypothetical protein